jgi:cytochrome c oxidase cbb3-type subunit I
MTYLIPRLFKREWYSRQLCEWHYWLSAGGIVLMFLDLTFAGILQGYHWASLESWDVSLQVSHPFWVVRVFAGLGIIGGQLCFFYNIYATWRLGAEPALGREALQAA